MDRLQNDEEILKKLKEKVEGRCMQEYGYILQVSKNPNAKSNAGIDIGVPKVDVDGCTVLITFSAISFKRTHLITQLKRTTSLISLFQRSAMGASRPK